MYERDPSMMHYATPSKKRIIISGKCKGKELKGVGREFSYK